MINQAIAKQIKDRRICYKIPPPSLSQREELPLMGKEGLMEIFGK